MWLTLYNLTSYRRYFAFYGCKQGFFEIFIGYVLIGFALNWGCLISRFNCTSYFSNSFPSKNLALDFAYSWYPFFHDMNIRTEIVNSSATRLAHILFKCRELCAIYDAQKIVHDIKRRINTVVHWHCSWKWLWSQSTDFCQQHQKAYMA